MSTSLDGIKQMHILIIIIAVTAYHTVAPANSPIVILYFENRKIFCGLPIGVAILPRLAPIVCNTTIYIIYSAAPAAVRSSIAKGTKVMSATSLVIIIPEKKHIKTRIKYNILVFLIFSVIFSIISVNIPKLLNASTISISEKSNARTLKSI